MNSSQNNSSTIFYGRAIKLKPKGHTIILDHAVLALLFFFLLTEVFGGAIRYYAVQYGFPWLPYLPHLLLAVAVVPMFFIYLLSEGVTSTYLTLLILFSIGTACGIYNLNSASQVEFGLWVFVAFLYGVVVVPAVVRGWRSLTPFVLLLWMTAVAGVLINVFHSWPWIGLEYQIGSTVMEASRLWWTGGMAFDRLPGFSRASFDAAIQILILGLFLVETASRRWRVPIWIVSGVAIVLTTHKTALLVYVVFSVLLLLPRDPNSASLRLLPLVLAALDTLLPFSMLFVRPDWMDSTSSPIGAMVFSSFFERLQIGWPDWLRMIFDRGNLLLGRGLGGIGAAQTYFEPSLYSPGDNIVVYLYGTFGVLGIGFLCVYAWKAARLRVAGPVAHFFYLCACLVLIDGMTVNVLEGSFTAILFGASYRYLQQSPVCSASRASAERVRGVGVIQTENPICG